MQTNLPSINLVKNKQAPFLDRFMDWALTVGRLIVIVTEVVAVFAFIYRFSLDEKLVDLHSAIKQKQNIIAVLKNDEDKYRNLQDRITLASTLSDKGIKTNRTIDDVIALIPQDVKIRDLTFNNDRLSMNVSANSASSLTNFINPLKNHPVIKSISIDSIESNQFQNLSIDVSAIFK